MSKDLEKHIKKLLGDDDPKEIPEIILDTFQLAEIKDIDKRYLEKFINADSLFMNNCGLKSLKNLPTLPMLDSLELNDNKLEGKELQHLLIYPHLNSLRLSNNLIKNIDELKTLAKLHELTILDLTACPITNIDNYREEVFKAIPSLQVLDMAYKSGEPYESEDDDEEGEFDEEDSEGDFIVQDEENKEKEKDEEEDADEAEEEVEEEEEEDEAKEPQPSGKKQRKI